MTSKYNPYQVICKGNSCKLYKKCKDKCILKENSKKYLKGCNYSNGNGCNYCSHKKKCILIKPYSDKLNIIEKKRVWLEKENITLYEYISVLDNGDDVYFKRSKQQIIEKIEDNEKLIKAYQKKEEELLN